MKTIRVACAILVHDGRLLITQRLPDVDLPNLWEFPGGKIHEGESPEQALHREIDEELGVSVEIIRLLSMLEHQYPDKQNAIHHLYFFLCRLTSGTPEAKQASALRWVAPADLSGYAFPAADEELITQLPKWLSDQEPNS